MLLCLHNIPTYQACGALYVRIGMVVVVPGFVSRCQASADFSVLHGESNRGHVSLCNIHMLGICVSPCEACMYHQSLTVLGTDTWCDAEKAEGRRHWNVLHGEGPPHPSPFPCSEASRAPWAGHRPLLIMSPTWWGGGARGGWCLWCVTRRKQSKPGNA